MMNEAFVYVWTDHKTEMLYVGYHKGTQDDGYICSSNRMRDSYRRRPHDFKRRILKTNISERDFNKLIESSDIKITSN